MTFWLCGVLVFLLDRWTKYLIVHNLRLGETIPVINNFFHLTYIQNPGAAFGLLANKTWLLIMVTAVIFCVILYLQYTWGKNNLKLSVAFGLISGGAIGNFLDRLQTGYVIDFLDFRGVWGYIFNIADMAIVIAMFLLVWQIIITDYK